MKPLKLTMTAFGPYAEKTIIDFQQLNQGVYLITGDTGAGKTTIFDAIVFALYGVGSGSGRNDGMFHSDYVDKLTDTEVELRFANRGKEYRVCRKIHYQKKRSGGFGAIVKSAELYCQEEDVIEKETAVNSKIAEILGLDDKQFRQIVMLAQGEFRKFLESGSDMREQILGKLFDNRIYVEFQNRLKEAAEELKKEREDQEREIGFYLQNGSSMEELEVKIKEAEEKKLAQEQKLAVLDKQLRELQEKVQKAKQYYDKLAELEQVKNRQLSVKGQKEAAQALCRNLEEEKAACDKKLPLIDELKIQLQGIEKCIADYKLLEAKVQKSDMLLVQMEQEKKAQKASQDKINSITEEKSKLEEQVEALKDIEVQIARQEHELDALKMRTKQLQDIKERLKNIERLEKELEKKKALLKKKEEEFEKAAQHYIEENKLFLAGQAGLLAKELYKRVSEQGEANCPVCGSLVHGDYAMQFAKTEEQIPTQERVELARKRMEDKQKEAANCATDYNVSNNSLKQYIEEAKKAAADIPGLAMQWEMLLEPEIMKKCMEDQKELVQKEQSRLEELKKQQREKEKFEKRIADSSTMLERAGKELERSKASCAESEKHHVVVSMEIKNLQKTLVYESGEKAAEAQRETQNRKNTLEKEIKETEKQWNNCRVNLGNLQGQETELISQEKSGQEAVSKILKSNQWLLQYQEHTALTEELEKGIKEQLHEKKELEAERQSLVIELDHDKKSLKRVKELRAELDKTETTYRNLWRLSLLANGQSGEGGKYSFSRYVLGTFFEEIIDQANYHLNHMTGGKYELIRKQEAGRKNESAGLGMVIFDAYTGERRETASLSGGESFQVSLSLALGLSDVVRSHSGGCTLEAMFIDEGFGALDEQALDQAMSVLHELSGDTRQIGIISHVGKLSENISQKICVKRTPKGSSVQIIA